MKRNKILIIDDDTNICELLRVNLTSKEYDVTVAHNGKEALDIIDTFNPQIIILDVIMPEMDGWETCKIIRDNSNWQDIKILMLTSKNTDKDKMIGQAILNADKYMAKPFNIEKVLNIIEELSCE